MVAGIITLNYPHATCLVLISITNRMYSCIRWECERADFAKSPAQSKFTDLAELLFWYYLQRHSPYHLWQHRMRTAGAELGTQHQATGHLCGSVVARMTGAEPAASSVEVLKHKHKYGEMHSTIDTRVYSSSSYKNVTVGLWYHILLFLPHSFPHNKTTGEYS
jgi:hypothetical protein